MALRNDRTDWDRPEASELSRRRFIQTTAGMAAMVPAARMLGLAGHRVAAAAEPPAAVPAAGATSETLVASLYKSLDDGQRQKLCFPFDHPLRSAIDNNWQITKQSIAEALKPDQQAMVREIFRGVHSEEYAQRVYDQVEHDGGGPGSFADDCAIAMFGDPGDRSDGAASKFEFVLTGRHCTRRCDGNSVAGAAFGGPIFYGHAAEGFNEKPDTPATPTGSRPSAPTRCSRPSTASSATSPSAPTRAGRKASRPSNCPARPRACPASPSPT